MSSSRPQRTRRPKIIWEAAGDSTLRSAEKAVQKAPRNNKREALVPIALEPLPPSLEEELPTYQPPFNIRKKRGHPTFSGLSPLDTFKRFINKSIVDTVVINTNSYAQRQRDQLEPSFSRAWKPTTTNEIYRYIGIWIYMSLHPEYSREFFWSPTHQLGRSMSLRRFEQLHRYISLRDEAVYPRQPNETFAWKVEPVATIFRYNLLEN
jgi:hypothetical protein